MDNGRENFASRRALLTGAPALAVVGTIGATAHAATASPILAAIETHRTAWAAYDRALDDLEAAEDAFKIGENVFVPGLHGANYEARLGRDFALQNMQKEYAALVRRAEVALDAIGTDDAIAAGITARAHERLTEASTRVNAFFDAEDARKAASPLGVAQRAYEAASGAQEEAWEALLAVACQTLADVHAKAAYLLDCPCTKSVDLHPTDTVALLQSLAGGRNA